MKGSSTISIHLLDPTVTTSRRSMPRSNHFAMPGWGETEPNDNPGAADRLFLNRFYQANTLDKFDTDWYYVGSLRPNQNLIISFLGDQENYTDTAGWVVKIHDPNGNIIAAFDSLSSGQGNVYRPGDNENDVVDPNEPLLAKTPLSDAKIIVATLGNPGRYFISVESNEEDAGAERGYHIAAMISESDQISPNPDTNFSDVETENNDTQELADPLHSNVHMFGVFGRKIVKAYDGPCAMFFRVQTALRQHAAQCAQLFLTSRQMLAHRRMLEH